MTEYRVVDGIASTPKGQQLYDQAVANQNARDLANKNHKVTIANVSNRPKTAPRGESRYAIAQDLIDRGFPTVDGVPIPVTMEQLGQQQFIDTWRCDLDGTKATSANPKGELGYWTGRDRKKWVMKKKGVEIGDCYWRRTDTSRHTDTANQKNNYDTERPMSHPTVDYRVVGNRYGSFSGVERQFYGSWVKSGGRVGGTTKDWVIKKQQIYSDITGATTYKLKNGKKDGTWTSWWDYDKTRKEMQGTYKTGKMVDKWYFYNNKGNLKEIRYFSPVF